MTQIQLERKGAVMLMTVPPVDGLPALEQALSPRRLGLPAETRTCSRAEPTVVEVPYAIWKRTVGLLQDNFAEYSDFIARHVPKAPSDDAIARVFENNKVGLVYLLDGVIYQSVSDMSKEPDFEGSLGFFELSQSVLRVSDPCYAKESEGALTLKALPGLWRASVTLEDAGPEGMHVSRLTVSHESLGAPIDYAAFEETAIDVAGVDSGQCGFYDDALYPDAKHEFRYKGQTFYRGVCDSLRSKFGIGTAKGQSEYRGAIIPGGFGVASATFDGDGNYPCRVLRNEDGSVVAAYLWYAPYADPFFPDDGDYEQEEVE